MAARFKLDIGKFTRFAHRFARSYNNVSPEIVESLKNYTEKVFAQTQIFVPVDTGDLKGSGKVINIKNNKKTVSYAIQYGKSAAQAYAFWVEVREFTAGGTRVKHDPPTQAFYARDAHTMHIAELRNEMKNALQKLRANYAKGA